MSRTVRGEALRMADRLRGGKVLKELGNINALMTPRASVPVDQWSRLESILSYATNHVPFYRSLRSTRFSEFPVLTRATFKVPVMR